MGRRGPREGWGTTTRLRPELLDRARAEAEARGLSTSFLVNRVLAEGLDRLVPADELRLTRRPDSDGEYGLCDHGVPVDHRCYACQPRVVP